MLLISGGLCTAALGMRILSSGEVSQQNGRATPTTIKVVYLGMSTLMNGTKQEYLTLASPAHLSDVLSQIKQEHANLATMLPAMQIVVNGVPTQDNPLLPDNTEVDLIALYAGG